MINPWFGCDEEFFQGLFTYLKGKFHLKMHVFTGTMQKDTRRSIYHETIVALEGIHEVLRKIGNHSAPTREDYNNAVQHKNEERSQEIRDFYKKLALIDEFELNAFHNFTRYYFFDALIHHYSIFCQQYSQRNSNASFDLLFRRATSWDQASFDSDGVFRFIELYQASLLDGQVTEAIKNSIDEQVQLSEDLIGCYNELVDRNVNIGVSVVDIIFPSSLQAYESRPDFLSTERLIQTISRLENSFRNDDAILLTINHAHVIGSDHFILSYLLIYKASIYKSPTEVSDQVESRVTQIVGTLFQSQIKVINRGAMLKKLYPKDTFTGTLSSNKQKEAFRDKFLKYFLSSIFMMRLDQNEEMEYQTNIKGALLNKYIFYKEKLYNSNVSPVKPKVVKVESVYQKPNLKYLDELTDEIEFKKYFSNRGLSKDEIQKNQLIGFLYRQQDNIVIKDSILDDLIRIECFLSRLSCEPVYEFTNSSGKNSYGESPKWVKLSLLFQQFLLVSMMSFFKNNIRLPAGIYTKAIYFIDEYLSNFKSYYTIEETALLRRDLENYKADSLKPAIQQERQQLSRASKKVQSIQTYLTNILEKNVVIFRFIFKCGAVGFNDAKLFDDMFGDFIGNLKRRYTEGFRLVGQVGVYIPSPYEDYIDAVLFFEFSKNQDIDAETLRKAVICYWSHYVDEKGEQQKRFTQKQRNKSRVAMINPYVDFKKCKLTALSIPIVKTENSLNHGHIEIHQGQSKAKKLLVEKLALYYAYCDMILFEPESERFLPRKNPLIIGRIRSPHDPNSNTASTDVEGEGAA